jgi:hypothetical protein
LETGFEFGETPFEIGNPAFELVNAAPARARCSGKGLGLICR